MLYYDKIQIWKLVQNAPLFSSDSAKTFSKKISGTYYIYDGKACANGRYRLTNTAANCGKTPVGSYVTGYVSYDNFKWGAFLWRNRRKIRLMKCWRLESRFPKSLPFCTSRKTPSSPTYSESILTMSAWIAALPFCKCRTESRKNSAVTLAGCTTGTPIRKKCGMKMQPRFLVRFAESRCWATETIRENIAPVLVLRKEGINDERNWSP